jgi:PPM family protein phosphatase
LKISAKSDIGMVRDQNQDSYSAGELPGGGAWAVVCDGMGGASGGSIASSIATKIISEKIQTCYKHEMKSKSIRNLLFSAIEGSNISIFEMAKSDASLSGMGTTVVAAILSDNTIFIAHAGDSRAYLVNEKGIKQLTKDHSVVQVMVENGELTPDEAKAHPRKNIITRALGADEEISIDIYEEPAEKDDVIILCTDGLTNFIDADNILNIFKKSDYYEFAENLISFANKNGGGDNITVVTMAN